MSLFIKVRANEQPVVSVAAESSVNENVVYLIIFHEILITTYFRLKALISRRLLSNPEERNAKRRRFHSKAKHVAGRSLFLQVQLKKLMDCYRWNIFPAMTP